MGTLRCFSTTLAVLVLLLGFSMQAHDARAQAVVTNTNDSGFGSLRRAIENVVDGGTVIFNIPGTGPHTITLTTHADSTLGWTALWIDKAVVIDGSGEAEGVIITQDADRRLFTVSETGDLTLRNLTLDGGFVQGGKGASRGGSAGGGGGAAGLGGAIFSRGTLTIEGCTFTHNQAVGGDGGKGSTASGASAGSGGGGLATNGNNSKGGFPNPGLGGGCDEDGENGGFGGGGGGAGTGVSNCGPNKGGNGGFGGGGGGGGGRTGSGPGAGDGGAGGFGGGGGGGGHSYQSAHGTGRGGGFGGGNGKGGATRGDGGGGAGLGGALFIYSGSATITNSTFSDNTAQGGGGPGNPGKGIGGAIFKRSGSLTLLHVTIDGNTSADGASLFNYGGPLVINNSILANAQLGGDDLRVRSGTSSGAGNLIENPSGFNGEIVTTSDPDLQALADNGGPTQTYAILKTSPAMNAGDASATAGLTTDQRGTGFPRNQAAAPDIGAFELAAVDLAVSVSESPDPVVGGSGAGNLVSTVTLTNNGPSDATGVELSNVLTLPLGVTIDDLRVTGGSANHPDHDGHSTWTLAGLHAGASDTLTITLTVEALAGSGTDMIADAITVTAVDQFDTDASNDSASEATSIICPSVTTTADTGAGSLRQALTCANALAEPDTITFNIAGDGPHVITPATALPEITSPVVLDGASQPGNETLCTTAIADRPAYQIILDGGGSSFAGLRLGSGSDGSTIQGLNIRSFNYGLTGYASSNNTIACNFIGTDEHGEADLGNTTLGVFLGNAAVGNTIGGSDAGDGNLVSGNGKDGVRLRNSSTDGNTVAGNYIGTDKTGTQALGNGERGLYIYLGASDNIASDNLIAGNGTNGIHIADAGTSGNLVEGNLIGTTATGQAALGNGTSGVAINNEASANTLTGNVIAAQPNAGVAINNSSDNLIAGNFIGTDATGTLDLSNGDVGVLLANGATGNTVGGSGSGNTIAFNGQDGIRITNDASTGNTLSENALYANGHHGIDLNDDAVTANDPDDADSGPNQLQNYPVVSAAVLEASGDVTLTYQVDALPTHAAYPLTVEFFRADGDGEEGAVYLGSVTYEEAEAQAPVAVTVTPVEAVSIGAVVVATATDAAGNTSEFSSGLSVTGADGSVRYVSTTGTDAGNVCLVEANPCATLSHAMEQANTGDIIFLEAGTYTETTRLLNKLVRLQGPGALLR